MNEIGNIILALAGGIIFGIFFYGGLWYTVKRGVGSKHYMVIYLASYLLRTAVILSGFFLLGAGDLIQFIVCLLGFILARFAVFRYLSPLTSKPNQYES